MNVMNAQIKEADMGVSVVDCPDGLAAFMRPTSAAAVLRRRMPPEVKSWLERFDPGVLPSGRVILRPCDVANAVQQLFDIAGLPPGPERDWVAGDIVEQADMFSDLMTVQYLRLRLGVITSNACRKFHVDAITGRLVCTYRGTGTQYGISSDGDDPKDIVTVPTGAPILLRGTLWPADPPTGLLHRSPPIKGTGETRLVLVLDPVTDPENEE
jgi:hypothetical protein